MHILIIPSFLPPYGGYFCIEQAKALLQRGHRIGMVHCQQLGVTVYPWHFLTARYGRWEENLQPFADGREITLYRTNMRGMPRKIHDNQRRYCQIVKEMAEKYISRNGIPDIIHAHSSQWAGTAALEIFKEKNIPYVITEHLSSGVFYNSFGRPWKKETWARQLLREAMEKAKRVITVSEESVQDLATVFGSKYRTTTVSNIIDVDFFRFKPREPLTGRRFRFCCLAIANGKFYTLKGYDTLFQALEMIEGVELHIAGRSTKDIRMRKAVGALQGKNKVVLHGELTKEGVRDLLYHCDALVLASRSETQSLVTMEAMSTGIPVVNTTAIPMALRIPGASFTVPVGNAYALRDAMIAVQSVTPSEVISNIIKNMASPDNVSEKLERVFFESL